MVFPPKRKGLALKILNENLAQARFLLNHEDSERIRSSQEERVRFLQHVFPPSRPCDSTIDGRSHPRDGNTVHLSNSSPAGAACRLRSAVSPFATEFEKEDCIVRLEGCKHEMVFFVKVSKTPPNQAIRIPFLVLVFSDRFELSRRGGAPQTRNSGSRPCRGNV